MIHHSATRHIALAVAACATVAGSATGAFAEDWRFSATLYGWLPAADISSTVNGPGGPLSGSATSGVTDVLDALNFAFFAAGEARRGKFGLLADLVYTDLGVGGTGPGGVTRDLDLNMIMLTGSAAWRVWDDGRGHFDALAGARLVSADVGVSRSGPLVTASASESTTWIDPLIGARAGYAIYDRWSLSVLGNIGGFSVGSEFTWEIYAGASYAINQRISADFGYRYLSIDYQSSGKELDTQLYGPTAALTVRF